MKFLKWTALSLFLIAMIAFFGGHWALKSAVEKVGSHVLGTNITVEAINISPISGSGALYNLKVANPEGYSDDSAFKLGKLIFELNLKSLFTDKIVIEKIEIAGLEVLMEGGFTDNNLQALKANAQRFSSKSDAQPVADDGHDHEHAYEEKSSRTLMIKEFTLTGGKADIRLTGIAKAEFGADLPEVHLTNIGGDNGAGVGEVIEEVMTTVLGGVKNVAKGLSNQLNVNRVEEKVKSLKDDIKGFFNK